MRPLPLVRPPESAIDPVCGMTVDPARAAATREHAGKAFHFCHASCAWKFERDPEGWLSGRARGRAAAEAAAAPPGTEWICPMCPEVRETSPVPCPVCGMALEPAAPPSATPRDDPELRDMTRRFAVAAVLTLPLVGAHLAGHHSVHPWIQAALAAPVVLWAGAPILARGGSSVLRRRLNMFTLLALGIVTAFVASVVAAVSSGPLYFEAAAAITALALLGQVLELRARARTGDALRALLDLAPKTARRAAGGGDEEVPLDRVRVGDLLRVRPGEAVPVDGVVVEGASVVDESLVSGEPIPVDKATGSRVTGGTLNASGAFVMRADRVGADTALARIVARVAEAQRSRAPVQALADRVAAVFVPGVIAAAALTLGIWALAGDPATGLLAAVSVVVIACPCALGLATPMAVTTGMGRGARDGILFRDAAALETLGRVDTLVVDKTGTLTAGRAEVAAVAAADGDGESTRRAVVGIAASVERWSEHPLAAAVLREAQRLRIEPAASGAFRSIPGKGAAASTGGQAVAVGNRALLDDLGVKAGADLLDRAAAEENEGRTVAFVVSAGRAAGLLAFADPVKPTSAEAVRMLREDGVDLVLASGDTAAAAGAVGRTLGIGRVEAGVSPARKEEVVRGLQASGRVVAMAGDGVNDAPALARAEVGIAMGRGADVAKETAGVTLVHGDLRGIARARRLSRATLRNIRQNLALAVGYNALCIPLAAGVLYPATGLLLSPMLAAAAMSLSSVSVIANALRLRGTKL